MLPGRGRGVPASSEEYLAHGSEQKDDAALLLPRRALGDVRANGERLRLLDRLPRQRGDALLRAVEELSVAARPADDRRSRRSERERESGQQRSEQQ